MRKYFVILNLVIFSHHCTPCTLPYQFVSTQRNKTTKNLLFINACDIFDSTLSVFYALVALFALITETLINISLIYFRNKTNKKKIY